MTPQLKRCEEGWRRTARRQLGIAAVATLIGLASNGPALALPSTRDTMIRAAGEQEQVRFALTLPLQHQPELHDLLHHLYTAGELLRLNQLQPAVAKVPAPAQLNLFGVQEAG